MEFMQEMRSVNFHCKCGWKIIVETRLNCSMAILSMGFIFHHISFLCFSLPSLFFSWLFLSIAFLFHCSSFFHDISSMVCLFHGIFVTWHFCSMAILSVGFIFHHITILCFYLPWLEIMVETRSINSHCKCGWKITMETSLHCDWNVPWQFCSMVILFHGNSVL